jgi:hypothetical protein
MGPRQSAFLLFPQTLLEFAEMPAALRFLEYEVLRHRPVERERDFPKPQRLAIVDMSCLLMLCKKKFQVLYKNLHSSNKLLLVTQAP